jgi:small neutral amino acid transporter SnatA (MarC family)
VQGDYISAVVLLLLVLDPFGNIPIFIAALREVPADRRRRGIRSFVATL